MKRSITLLLSIILAFNLCAQNKLRISNSLALLGQGDYFAYHFSNSLMIKKGLFYLEPSLGFIVSSDARPGYDRFWHNNSYINLDFNTYINPLNSKKFQLYTGAGLSARYRSEIIPYIIGFVNDGLGGYTYDITYNNYSCFDYGYIISILGTAPISRRVELGFNLMLSTYNKGTSVAAAGFTLIYTL